MSEIEKGLIKESKNCFTLPSLKEFLLYTSLVVAGAAVLIPLDANFGLINFIQNLDLHAPKGLNLFEYAAHKIFADKDTVFTKEQLSHYDKDSSILYLAVLGKVFDVSKGRKFYGKGGQYSFFSGKDASRAFVSGKFDVEGLVDNIEGLRPEDYLGLRQWLELYQKQYTYVGKLEGYFYDANGNPTKGVQVYDTGVIEGLKSQQSNEEDRKMFPECNSEWTHETGTYVWCSLHSGGIKRDWIGYPRQYFKAGQSQKRCACIQEKGLNDPRVKLYEGCPTRARRCKVD